MLCFTAQRNTAYSEIMHRVKALLVALCSLCYKNYANNHMLVFMWLKINSCDHSLLDCELWCLNMCILLPASLASWWTCLSPHLLVDETCSFPHLLVGEHVRLLTCLTCLLVNMFISSPAYWWTCSSPYMLVSKHVHLLTYMLVNMFIFLPALPASWWTCSSSYLIHLLVGEHVYLLTCFTC